jgi:hypothetical protein
MAVAAPMPTVKATIARKATAFALFHDRQT